MRLEQARAAAREPALTRYEADLYAPVEVYDTDFSGAGGDRIRAWYLRPAGADQPGEARPGHPGPGGRWGTGATGDQAPGRAQARTTPW
jgi:hypothetical protein